MKQIRLTKGLYALVNDEDFHFVNQWSWYASNESRGTKWYAVRREKGVKIRMHVEILKRHLNLTQIPKGFVVDHVNHNSLDNRLFDIETDAQGRSSRCLQLEMVTQVENMRRSPGWKKKGMKVG